VKVPAVLAECGFLSNPIELAKLKTPEYKQSVALVLYLGIMKYISFNDV
jgi:N-acetylmuramoyl-L-alanine amidase